jgi:mRNA-degrading endonuclease RelE of RelBE toxin-antitoxin system
MAYVLRYSVESIERLKNLAAHDRAEILDQIKRILAVNPTLVSKAKVKLLKQPAPTEYRLRVREFRVFYNVEEENVLIATILSKEDAISYLAGSEGEQE